MDERPILYIVAHGRRIDVRADCREIRKAKRPGLHCDIPYIEVLNYQGEVMAEFCQHSLEGVYYADINGAPA